MPIKELTTSLMDGASVMYHMVDANTREIIFTNKKWKEVLGYSDQDIIGKTSFDLVHPEFHEQLEASIKRLRKMERGIEIELKLKKKNGEYINCFTVPNPIILDDKPYIVVLLIPTDDLQEVVAGKSAQEELKKTNVILEAIVENIPTGIFLKEAKGLTYEFVNDNFAIPDGFKKEDLIGKTDYDFIDKETAAIYEAKSRACIASKKPDRTDIVEYDFKGKHYVVQTHRVPILDKDGNVTHILILSNDYTEIHQKQKELERVNAFLDSIIENIPDMIFIKEADELKFELFNKAGEELLGLKREKLLGKTDYDIFPKEQADHFVETDRKVLSTKELSVTDEEVIESKKGKKILKTKKMPLLDAEGNVTHLLGISEDVTDFKKAQQALVQSSKMVALGEMASGVAHEINNPLAIISGDAYLLKTLLKNGMFEEKKFLRSLTRIERTVQRIADIISGLRKFSMGEDQSSEMVDIKISQVIDDTFSLCRERFLSNGISFNLDIDDHLVKCRPIQISQVLLNLLNNAFDAVAKQDEKIIDIKTSLTEDKKQLRVCVRDNGPGVKSDVKAKLFQPFYTTKSPQKGTGLGLSISKGIIDSHGGSLELCEVTQGFCIGFTLPLAD